jgi:hypothetical protein
MNEKKKLEESRYFLSRMEQVQDERFEFKCNLSGFLSASRSVLQYAHAEAKKTRSGLQWYESTINKEPILKFFKDKRDINIHQQPISPSAKTKIGIHGTVSLSSSISVVVRDKDGNIKDEYHSKPSQTPTKIKPPETTKTVTYFFSNWTGDEDVITICKKYLDKLEKLVNDGIRQGYISG